MSRVSVALRALAASAIVLLAAATASAGIHTWNVSEVFSNASGTIQFVELKNEDTPGEVNVGNGAISSDTQAHNWSNGAVTGPTNNKFYLIASPAFVGLPGAPTPDVVLPASVIPFFSTGSDAVTFSTWDTCTFASAPSDGVNSLDCLAVSEGVNTPTNYAGATGSIDVSSPVTVPVSPAAMLWILTGLLLMTGMAFLFMRRPVRA